MNINRKYDTLELYDNAKIRGGGTINKSLKVLDAITCDTLDVDTFNSSSLFTIINNCTATTTTITNTLSVGTLIVDNVDISTGLVVDNLTLLDNSTFGNVMVTQNAIKLGCTNDQETGMLRFCDSKFQGFNGIDWVTLDSTSFIYDTITGTIIEGIDNFITGTTFISGTIDINTLTNNNHIIYDTETNLNCNQLTANSYIKLSSSTDNTNGNIRFENGQFEGYDGEWKKLDGFTSISSNLDSITLTAPLINQSTTVFQNTINIQTLISNNHLMIDNNTNLYSNRFISNSYINLGNSSDTITGNITYDGTNFKGYDGIEFINLDQQTVDTTNVSFDYVTIDNGIISYGLNNFNNVLNSTTGNIGIGSSVLQQITNQNNNIAFGYNVLKNNLSNNNIAIGNACLETFNDGGTNIAINSQLQSGKYNLLLNSNVDESTYSIIMNSTSTGTHQNDILLGSNITKLGASNICLGNNINFQTGQNNILIGNLSISNEINNNLNIADIITGDLSTTEIHFQTELYVNDVKFELDETTYTIVENAKIIDSNTGLYTLSIDDKIGYYYRNDTPTCNNIYEMYVLLHSNDPPHTGTISLSVYEDTAPLSYNMNLLNTVGYIDASSLTTTPTWYRIGSNIVTLGYLSAFLLENNSDKDIICTKTTDFVYNFTDRFRGIKQVSSTWSNANADGILMSIGARYDYTVTHNRFKNGKTKIINYSASYPVNYSEFSISSNQSLSNSAIFGLPIYELTVIDGNIINVWEIPNAINNETGCAHNGVYIVSQTNTSNIINTYNNNIGQSSDFLISYYNTFTVNHVSPENESTDNILLFRPTKTGGTSGYNSSTVTSTFELTTL